MTPEICHGHYVKLSDWERLEAELAEAVAALSEIRVGLSNTNVCCGNPIPGHPGNYWEPPDAPECCREPNLLHDICDRVLAKHSKT